jgi:hypothetical protein
VDTPVHLYSVLTYTFTVSLAFTPTYIYLMNLCMYVIMASISVTSYALFITIKWTLAK